MLGAKRVIFEKPGLLGEHMIPLYIKGHLDGVPVSRMLVDGDACVNIMPCLVFEKLGYMDEELMKTNMTLRGFSGEASKAKGIVSMELTVGSKTIPMVFFVMKVKGRYKLLLGPDWIHANGCVPSMLHQCVIQWVRDEMEMLEVYSSECVAAVKAEGDFHGKDVRCLTGTDLSEYDYISVGQADLFL
jgi:hypothetical protein